MGQKKKQLLQFKVSTALKNIIGKDLINDRYIAVFELVKNAYDAGASRVDITFKNLNTHEAKLIIQDDGTGMSLEDIRNKWLFVAYSEKRKANRKEVLNDKKIREDYREHIKRKAAGAKGVGRFSCDRLGAMVNLKTRTENDEYVNCLEIDWNQFEIDDEKELKSVDIPFFQQSGDRFLKGTILEISQLREGWNREDFLTLKRALMKLINPESDLSEDKFDIYIHVDSELKSDNELNKNGEEKRQNEIVNGRIRNDIIEKLNIKTTNINVTVSKDGSKIITELYDRGQFIFRFKEQNREFMKLKNMKFMLLYLNRSAKYNFTSVMGMPATQYGSIFVYKNGFRVYPYGEPGKDVFDIDKRKSQGRNRFLGTRDLIGRVQILGDNDDFTETTSRDGGFVQNEAILSFYQFFTRRVLRTLEKYVVDVIAWGDPSKEDYDAGAEQGLMPQDVAVEILKQFAGYSNSKKKDLIDFEYSDDLIQTLNSKKEESVTTSVKKIVNIASKSENKALVLLAERVKRDTDKLLKQKIEVDEELESTQQELGEAKKEIHIRKEQNYFLEQTVSKNAQYLMSGMHLNYTHSEGARNSLLDLRDELNKLGYLDGIIQELVAEVMVNVQKINKTSEYAIKGNFDLDSTKEKNDIRDFISQYITLSKYKGIEVKLEAEEMGEYKCVFDVSSIGIIIDNIVSNSKKANAKQLWIIFEKVSDEIVILFRDDGYGIDLEIGNINLLFELGVSTTKEMGGNGIGLSDVRMLVESMGGSIEINESYLDGFELIMRIRG